MVRATYSKTQTVCISYEMIIDVTMGFKIPSNMFYNCNVATLFATNGWMQALHASGAPF